MRLSRLIVLLLLVLPGCVYKMGSGFTAGMLDEIGGEGQTEGIEDVVVDLEESGAFARLGHQLGQALMSGVTDLSDEQQREIELIVDGALTVAATKTATGLRDEVSPELRAMVRQDIVETLAEGMRGELGDSFEDTVDRVVTRAVRSLEEGLADPVFRETMAATIREATYQAMREGRPGSPGVGETLETTLNRNVLDPVEHSVGGLAELVADRVDESALRTERTLQGVISALVMVLGVILVIYVLTRRQLARQRATAQVAEQELRTVGAALGELDPEARARILGKIDEYHQIAKGDTPAPKPRAKRSDLYVRDDD